ncbi:putative mannan endo-1,6-alpha-mannosidase DFG5 [Tricladium varicosporioides]|nr:putative mannan endo-1,6-alpha-mannosidase DFG5 [Hymenoscyphus varicosporioides]
MRWSSSLSCTAAFCALAGQVAEATITATITDQASVKSAAKIIAKDLMSYYTGDNPGDVAGNLPSPYYWWEAGAMFGTMINYWYYTGDTTYNGMTTRAMVHQIGEDTAFMPKNQSKTEGNDDQGFWGMAAMTAAETKFPDAGGDNPGWLALAQGTWTTQQGRWAEAAQTCGGGLRWQIFTFNNGYDYKNTISNGCFFNLGARLALYTGNATYADWAVRSFEWVWNIGLISPTYEVFDGTNIRDNCTSKDHNTWSYNAGIFLLGSATMYNYTNGSAIWQERVSGLLNTTISKFFVDGVMRELCEPSGKCNVDQRSFKAYLARWLAATVRLAPFTEKTITPLLQSSAAAALKTCTAGTSGTQCGLMWTTGSFDGSLGVGESMAALEVVQSNLITTTSAWASAAKGTGNSTGDITAGTTGAANKALTLKPITAGDRIGAGVLTALVMIGVVGGSATMMISE